MAIAESPPVAASPGPSPDVRLARRLLAVGAVLVLAFLPLLVTHVRQLWERPHYQFFPLAWLGAAVLAGSQLRGARELAPGSPWVSAAVLGLGWAALLTGGLLDSARLAAVAALLVLLAAALALGGGALARRLLPAWILLGLTVPPPFNLDRTLILALQSFTTRWSSALLDLLGVWHVMAGNVVEIAGRRLLVEEACSGINSLFSVLACTVFFILLVGRRPVHAALLLAAALGWVLVANVTRVVVVAAVSAWWGIDLLEGWRHDAVGFAMFAFALLMLWSTDRFLLLIFGPTAPARAPEATPAGAARETAGAPGGPLAAAGKTWLGSWKVAGLFGVVALVQAGLWAAAWGEETDRPDRIAPMLAALSASTLPERLEGWERKKFAEETREAASAYGERSRLWVYQRGHLSAVLSFDYPFPEWHDLVVCYANQGWEAGRPATRKEPLPGGGGPVPQVEVKLSRSGSRWGHLWFCEFDSQGTPLEPVRPGVTMSLNRYGAALRRAWGRLTGDLAPAPPGPVGKVYQVQLFLESSAPLTEEEREQALALFREGVGRLRGGWSGRE
jgi:exosortase